MQRYNPLFRKVKQIIDEGLLGSFRHGFFENYASDEDLDAGHWFWDPSRSGGIFIEHGVHFFDLFAGWLGEGKVAGAWQWERRDTIVDRVQASVMYKTGMVNFYHGFDQLRVLDRQEMRLQFQNGDLTLREWVPVSMRLHGVMEKEQVDRLHEIIGKEGTGATRDRIAREGPQTSNQVLLTLEYKNPLGKQDLYRQMLTAMITDQRRRISEPGHIPVIDDRNAVRSLEMAEEASRMARLAEIAAGWLRPPLRRKRHKKGGPGNAD